ncbi:MAG: biopolymer transporter ExbD [Lentisphaeria bacterium]|nr:biopolymer transporter ExbD [Lentisphaeria bacterium]
MSSRRRFPVTAYDQINLTNLIDTLFFLLIIFMITAPLLEYSVDVTPPEMNANPIKPDTDSKIINVKADGSIVFDRRVVSETELQAALSRIEQESGRDTAIYLRGDKDLRYGAVMNVMRLVRGAGFRNVNLVMQEETKP